MKIFICVFYISKSFASISRLFQVRRVLLLSLTLHSLENLVIACCLPDFSVDLEKFLQLKFRESVQFMNIAKILPRENFPLNGNSTIFACLILISSAKSFTAEELFKVLVL